MVYFGALKDLKRENQLKKVFVLVFANPQNMLIVSSIDVHTEYQSNTNLLKEIPAYLSVTIQVINASECGYHFKSYT